MVKKKAKKSTKAHTKAKVHKHKQSKKSKSIGPIHKLLIGLAAVIVILLVFTLSKGTDVAVTVNGEAITNKYIDEQYERIPTAYKSQIDRDVVLQQAVNEVLLLQEAAKLQITTTEEEVDQFVADTITQSGLSEEEFRDRLEEQDLSMNDLKELYKKQLTINKLIDAQVVSKIDVSDSDLRSFYNENKDQFTLGEQITASHILILTESRSQEEAKKLIDEIASKATPENFADLAIESSEGPSGPKGGDLGPFGKGAMVAPFEKVAFATPVGEISEPVLTQFGWHIIYVRDKTSAGTQSFVDVRDAIKTQIVQEKAQSAVLEYVNTLQANSQVVFTE